MPDLPHWLAHAVFLADLLIRVGFSLRVIHRRLPVGVALAWLAVILFIPFAGAVLYLFLGEYRLGHLRAERAAAFRQRRRELPQADPVRFTDLSPECAAVGRLAVATLAAVPLSGNRLVLLRDADDAFPALIADIDRATRSCDLEFYIWDLGGRADEVCAALARAVKREVRCRILADALGSRAFLKSKQARDLRQVGVRVEAALASGLFRLLTRRPDLRLHRKIAVIDDAVAYTGSLNLADPLFFKRDAGVGHWVDALARVEGPAVAALADVFREDWELETGESLDAERPKQPATVAGQAVIQVLPTGPDSHVEAIEQVVLMALYGARREVVLTTPYFVPSESLLIALLSAAQRGVQVTLILPAKVDSRLVHFASRAFQTDLLTAGVRVAVYQRGMLHTKSITVDDQFSLFGSLNLDPRSLRLNFEITLAIYDAEFTRSLRQLQESYIAESQMVDLPACRARSRIECLAEDSARLIGPLL
jgi:cardiolipin synthase